MPDKPLRRRPHRAFVCTPAALFCSALARGAASPGAATAPQAAGMKPVRPLARHAPATAVYRAQLMPGPTREVGERIEMGGVSIPARSDASGRLQLDMKGDGRLWRTFTGSGQGVPVKLVRDGVKSPLSVTLGLEMQPDGAWLFWNSTVLLLQIGPDAVVVVDADADGAYNEPGVDGMTWHGSDYLFPLPGPSEHWCTPTQELKGLSFGPWGEDPQVEAGPLATSAPQALPVLRGVNEERVRLGLAPRPESPRLSSDLQRHCRYMASTGKLGHPEDKGNPAYSPEGHAAGMRSILSMGTPPERVALMMVTTYFHRQDVIRPETRAFGVGYEGRFGGIDGRTDLDRSYRFQWPVLCPAPEQGGVPLHYCREAPDATPGDDRAGYPITAYFGTGKLALTSYSLVPLVRGPAGTKEGAPVECYEYDPKKGAGASFTAFQRCICVIPKDPLSAGTTYRVTLEATVSGVPWKRTWSFTTGGGGGRPR